MADIRTAYDELTDVLYFSVGKPTREARSCSDEHGLVWRTLPTGECVGVTIPNAHSWARRVNDLRLIVSEKLKVSRKSVRIPEFA